MSTRDLIAVAGGILLAMAVTGCAGTSSTTASPSSLTSPARPLATASGGGASEGANPANRLTVPGPDPAELARLVVTDGTVTTRSGHSPAATQQYVVRGRCTAAESTAKLSYAVVDAAQPSTVLTAGEISCNTNHDTVNTALPQGMTSKPVTLVLKDDSAEITQGFAIVVPVS